MWIFFATIIVMAVGFVPAAALFDTHSRLAHTAGALACLAYFGVVWGVVNAWNRWWLERQGHVQADERGLWLDDTLLVARSSIRHGYLLRRDGASYVRLVRVLRLVDVAVDDDDEGERLLAAMRLDPARSVGLYPMNHGTHRSTWIRVLSVYGLFILAQLAMFLGLSLLPSADAYVVVMPYFLIFAATLAWAANLSVRVAVGADGIRIRRRLSRARFIPFSAVESAKGDGRDVVLRLRDRTVIEMHHIGGRKDGKKAWMGIVFRDHAGDGRMLVDRVNGQIENHKRARGHLPALARANRSTREWMREVTVASDDHSSFRVPAVPVDELWRVVEDPAAPSTERAGAALALRARLDDESRNRLRLLADACAAPQLRVALQVAASTAEEDAIEEAFEALHDDEHRAGVRRA